MDSQKAAQRDSVWGHLWVDQRVEQKEKPWAVWKVQHWVELKELQTAGLKAVQRAA